MKDGGRTAFADGGRAGYLGGGPVPGDPYGLTQNASAMYSGIPYLQAAGGQGGLNIPMGGAGQRQIMQPQRSILPEEQSGIKNAISMGTSIASLGEAGGKLLNKLTTKPGTDTPASTLKEGIGNAVDKTKNFFGVGDKEVNLGGLNTDVATLDPSMFKNFDPSMLSAFAANGGRIGHNSGGRAGFGFGGIPGTPFGDGADGHSLWPNFTNVPNEYLEAYFPLRIETYETIPDSGGAGKHRGGNALRVAYRFLEDGEISIHDDRWLTYPWGVNGGTPGRRSHKRLLRADGSEQVLPAKCDRVVVAANDLLMFETWGGGGWGDPYQRAPDLVARDVRRGLQTRDGAARFGVVLTANGDVDEPATLALRAARPTSAPAVFDRGGEIAALKARCPLTWPKAGCGRLRAATATGRRAGRLPPKRRNCACASACSRLDCSAWRLAWRAAAKSTSTRLGR
jgi:hypothetical protein